MREKGEELRAKGKEGVQAEIRALWSGMSESDMCVCPPSYLPTYLPTDLPAYLSTLQKVYAERVKNKDY